MAGTPYQTTGGATAAGGKFRKKPFRRNIPPTPYTRPPNNNNNNNPSFLRKRIVDPTSRFITSGVHKLFGKIFRNTPLLLQQPEEINEEPQNVPRETGQSGISANISAASGISELEQMLQQKTFTRSEIERLTALLHSRTTESSVDAVERDGAKPYSSPSSYLRIEASTSGSLKKHGDERDNLHAAISTPIVTSRVLEEEIASPAELAKAYMGSRPTKVAPSALRQDNAMAPPKTPFTSIAPKTAYSFTGLENGFTTPRPRGRSAMYSMARTPYARSPSTFTQKGITSSYGREVALTSSQSTYENGGKMALKRRSSVLDDDIGSGGPLRRTRQKANLLSQRDKRELGYTTLQQPGTTSQKLLLMNGSEPKVGAEENGDTSMRGSGSSYASVPAKSTQTATKILQHLEKPSPKERDSGSTKSPTKLTLDMLHGQALRSLEKVDSTKLLPYTHDSQKSEIQHHAKLHDSQELNSKGKEKIEENGSRKFPSPRNMVTSVNGDLSITSKDKAPAVSINELPSTLLVEPPQRKRAFQMSAPDDSFEMDDDIQVNGHVSSPFVENNKSETSLAAEIIRTPTLPEVSKTPALVENNKSAFPEVVKVPEPVELKEAEKDTSSPKTGFGIVGGFVSEQGIGLKSPTSPSSTTTTQTNMLPQSTLQMDNVAPKKDSNSFPLFGTGAETVSPFSFSAIEPSGFKPNASSDPKALDSTSMFNSVIRNGHVKSSESNQDANGNDQKSANIFGKLESSPSIVPAVTSTNAIFSFGNSSNNSSTPNNPSTPNTSASIFGKPESSPSAVPAVTSQNGIFSFGTSTNNSSTSNMTPASSPPTLPSLAPFSTSGATTTSLYNSSSVNVTSTSIASTTTTAPVKPTPTVTTPAGIFSTSVPTPVFSVPAPPPVFGFGSAVSTAPTTSAVETGNTTVANEKEQKFNMTNSSFATTPFASTSFAATTTRSSVFGFSSPAVTSTTNNQSQASFFNISNGSQANTQASAAVTQSVPFQFGSGSTAIPSSTSGASLFGSSAPAFSSSPSFGISSMAASSDGKSGNSTSAPATSVFGSTWQPANSSGFGSTFRFGASSTPTPSTTISPSVFGSSNTGGFGLSNTGGATGFSFGAGGATNSSFSTPTQNQPLFGNSTTTFGAAATTPMNNDHMSMEDSMAEDSMQSPTPTTPVTPFGQAPVAAAPSFMFGSATPNPIQSSASFQFGGQPNQPSPQNLFQSSSVEHNAGGGSFSLGTGGGDKAGRRIVKINRKGTARRK